MDRIPLRENLKKYKAKNINELTLKMREFFGLKKGDILEIKLIKR